jgi:hypothetical protein
MIRHLPFSCGALFLAWAAVAPATQRPAPCRQDDFDKVAGLTLQEKVDAFRAMSPKGSSTGGRDEQRMECLILSIDATSLSRFKFELEYDGDYKDLVEYAFHDIDNEGRQRNILAHFRTAPRESRVKVLTDVDDTMLANLVDRRYAKGTLYPGVVAFYDSLKQEPFATTQVPVTTLSARPDPLVGIAEEASLRSIRDLTANRLSPSGQSGAFKSSVIGTIETLVRASNKPYLKRLSDRVPFNKEDEIGEVKFANCQQFCAVFPEYQYVFVGDSGQADALTAQLLTNGQMAEGMARPITTFIHDLRESSDDLRAVSPAFKRLSPEDLVGDPPEARRGIIVFRNYIQAATIAYLQRDTLSNLIDANELAAITRAALADFERVAATAPLRSTLEGQYKADAERATALVAAAGLVPAAGGELRRTLDGPFWKEVAIRQKAFHNLTQLASSRARPLSFD